MPILCTTGREEEIDPRRLGASANVCDGLWNSEQRQAKQGWPRNSRIMCRAGSSMGVELRSQTYLYY
jgi:hypothetical protein